jgi:hypothetical protein
MGWESWDRESLYYIKDRDSAVYSKALEGGPEQKVIDSIVQYGFHPSKSGIYAISSLVFDGAELETNPERFLWRLSQF